MLWSRKAMRMIDTALESLDFLLLDDKILGTTGVPYVFVIFHLWLRVKCFIQQFDWKNVIFGYHAYQYGTQNYSSRKVRYLGFPTPCPIQFSNFCIRLCVVVMFEYFHRKVHMFECPFTFVKITNVPSFINFDPIKLWGLSSRRW